MTQPSEDDAIRLGMLLAESRRAVVFTGAGISTESGIPDFRSPGGLWSRYRPVEFSDFLADAGKRRESWRLMFALGETLSAARPNAGHVAVARLVAAGKVSHVITQNVDGLHQQAGVPDGQVIELHGTTRYARCLTCGKRFDPSPIKERFLKDETLPMCDACGGIVKSATISFGQSMPEEELRRADAAVAGCDLLLAIGSSLVVYPAASYPERAKQHGARLVILNRDPTPYDDIADLVLHREIGPTLTAAMLQERSAP